MKECNKNSYKYLLENLEKNDLKIKDIFDCIFCVLDSIPLDIKREHRQRNILRLLNNIYTLKDYADTLMIQNEDCNAKLYHKLRKAKRI